MIAVSDSEDDDDDNNEEREEAAEVVKINTIRVTRQSEKRNTQI